MAGFGKARVYDDRSDGDGKRVLVDRLWPRGMSKEDPRMDEWIKDAAPSADLRRWYGHDADRYKEFGERYEAELADDDHADAVEKLLTLADKGHVTLLTATKDIDDSHVPILLRVLKKK